MCGSAGNPVYFMMPEQARTLTAFACCGWLFDKALQRQLPVRYLKSAPAYMSSFFERLTPTKPQELAVHSLAMANKWQLNLTLIATLEVFADLKEPQQIQMKSRHPYYLLELASHLTI